MSFAGASAAACSLGGHVATGLAYGITKPIEIAAKHPKAAKTALGGLAVAPFAIDVAVDDEDDDLDEEEEIAQP